MYTRGVGKIGDFRRKWPISRKRCEIGQWLLYGTLIGINVKKTVSLKHSVRAIKS